VTRAPGFLIVCVAAFLPHWGGLQAADLPQLLTYRQLLTDPAEYSGRRVSVAACASTAMHHGAYLYDCDDPDAQIVTLGGSRAAEQALFGQHSVVEQRRVSATVTGVFTFEPDAQAACCMDTRYMLELDAVSGVTSLPVEQP